MKSIFLFGLLLISQGAGAAEIPKDCSYKLDHENGWEDKADGVLTYKGKKFRCRTLHVGSDMLTPCQKEGSKSATRYDYTIGFDGAELDFFVEDGIFGDNQPVCHNQATAAKP